MKKENAEKYKEVEHKCQCISCGVEENSTPQWIDTYLSNNFRTDLSACESILNMKER